MYPGHSRTTTRSVYRRAMATVSSVLSESTTTISSAQATDASAWPISAASFLVMTVTESFGTQRSLLAGQDRQEGQDYPALHVTATRAPRWSPARRCR